MTASVDTVKRKKGAYGKTAKLSAVWDFAGRISSQGVLFVVSIFLARLLTPADFGITAAAKFFVTLASRLTQLGLNASLVRMKEIRPEHSSSVFVVNLVMGAIAYVTLYLASPWLGRLFGNANVGRVLPVTATVFLIAPFGSVAAAMLNRHLRYRTSTVIQWFDAVAGSILALVLAFFGFGYWSLVLGALGAAVLSTAAKVYFSPWRPSLRFSRSALRDTLSFGLGFQTWNLLQFSATNLDNLVVGRLLGVTSLGYYDKAYGLMHQLTNRMSFDAALMRIFAILTDEPERFRKALLKGIQATSIITFPLLSFSLVAAQPIVVVLFGPKWTPSIGPFRVLALAGIVMAAMRSVNAANASLGLVWLQTAQQLLYVTMIVVGVAVGSHWGLTAAAMGVLFGVFVNAAISMQFLTRHSIVTAADLWSAAWPSVATSGAMCAAALGVNGALHAASTPHPWVVLLFMTATAAITYPALILWTPFQSIGEVVRESVDDVAPWIRPWLDVGVLRVPTAQILEAATAAGSNSGREKANSA